MDTVDPVQWIELRVSSLGCLYETRDTIGKMRSHSHSSAQAVTKKFETNAEHSNLEVMEEPGDNEQEARCLWTKIQAHSAVDLQHRR